MLRFLFGLLLLSSCSVGVIKKGGNKSYAYDVEQTYSIDELKILAPGVVTTLRRDPEKGTLERLFSPEQPPLRRIGILVFESSIQPTVSGLASDDQVYLSASGKQILTENLFNLWEESLPILGDSVEYVDSAEIKNSKAFKAAGSEVKDHVLAQRDTLAPDDIFYVEKGKTTTTSTVLNARGMRDFSLALVPATELMAGPKFSEHAKHTLNEVARELNLDALIIVMNKINWTATHTDKRTGESFPEEAQVQIEASVLVPFSSYQSRLKTLGELRDLPKTTVAFRSYEARLKIPVKITTGPADQNYESIRKELLTPVLNTYNDLTHMVQLQMLKDLKKTQQ